jgi:hypothetical protein
MKRADILVRCFASAGRRLQSFRNCGKSGNTMLCLASGLFIRWRSSPMTPSVNIDLVAPAPNDSDLPASVLKPGLELALDIVLRKSFGGAVCWEAFPRQRRRLRR